MKVGIIGLGLMGASFAKTLHAKGAAEVYGTDINPDVMKKAKAFGIVDGELTLHNANLVDMIIVSTYPRVFASALAPFLPCLKAGTVVTDFCGTKRMVVSAMQEMSKNYPELYFVGCHPMAGVEYYGIEHAISTLFNKASVILVPCSQNIFKLQFVKDFLLSLGVGEVVICDADYHDAMIAYTSQLCHVVSNAFIKNESAARHSGYSAGSYKDLTRVARMNSKMWAELMTDNRDKLVSELSELIQNLQQYKNALELGDEQQLYGLLEEGNQRKLKIDTDKR